MIFSFVLSMAVMFILFLNKPKDISDTVDIFFASRDPITAQKLFQLALLGPCHLWFSGLSIWIPSDMIHLDVVLSVPVLIL